MYGKPRAIAGYGKIANMETNSLKQIVMLYDGAIKFLNLTADDIDAEDFVAKSEHSNRALDIIGYLKGILDFEKGGNAAVILDELYRSINVLVIRASAELDSDLMRRAANMLSPVRDAWETNAQSSINAAQNPQSATFDLAA